MRLHRACLTSLFALLPATAFANTEKVIFLAPASAKPSESLSGVERLFPHTFTPANNSVRTSLPVRFASDDRTHGYQYWYLLRHLNPRQRYEVRICWAASQPTDFFLEVVDIELLLRDPDLFLSSERSRSNNAETRSAAYTIQKVESAIGLRIQATADFFTTNQTLMRHPPPVDVDIILDPYLANIFPASLVPTAVYIIVLAIIAWYVSGIIWSILQGIASQNKSHAD